MKTFHWKVLKKLNQESKLLPKGNEELMFYNKRKKRIVKHYKILIDCTSFHRKDVA